MLSMQLTTYLNIRMFLKQELIRSPIINIGAGVRSVAPIAGLIQLSMLLDTLN